MSSPKSVGCLSTFEVEMSIIQAGPRHRFPDTITVASLNSDPVPRVFFNHHHHDDAQ